MLVHENHKSLFCIFITTFFLEPTPYSLRQPFGNQLPSLFRHLKQESSSSSIHHHHSYLLALLHFRLKLTCSTNPFHHKLFHQPAKLLSRTLRLFLGFILLSISGQPESSEKALLNASFLFTFSFRSDPHQNVSKVW